MKKLLAAALCVLPGILVAAGDGTVQINLLRPTAGEVLRPGQTYTVSWEVLGAPKDLDDWCEQEILLSIDGGQTFDRRITKELHHSARSVDFVVPLVESKAAVLDVRFGCQDGAIPEASHPQPQATFRINRGRFALPPGLSVTSAGPALALAGDEIFVSWESTVPNAREYEVFVSYDRGGHFVSVGKTTDQTYSFQAPDSVGRMHFQVVAYGTSGEAVRSDVLMSKAVRVVPSTMPTR